MRPGRSIRGRFAGVVKRDRRAVGHARVQHAHPTRGRSKPHGPGATGWRHESLWWRRRNSAPSGQVSSRLTAVVRKLRPPGDVRSKPQTSRAGRWREGGLAVSTISGRRPRPRSPFCSGPARDLSPWVRWTPGVPRPLGLYRGGIGHMTRAQNAPRERRRFA